MKPWHILIISVLTGIVIYSLKTPDQTVADIDVISYSENIENLLGKYKQLIGDDFDGYRGHLYRVLSYANYFLKGDETNRDVIEAALVYHDIGLWTDNTLSYLDPSYLRAEQDLASKFNQEQMQLIHDIIIYHHKITEFTGPNQQYVEAVRKADWIDATKGVVLKGISRANVEKVRQNIPDSGFYDTLAGFGPKLYGYNVFKIVNELRQIYYL
eukprot:TRINITY_DN2854_c0_g1_i2.p1 TRINITY_DN2854_c0_g1~~TRINITY_DN2854_c0_g1_i2.p1  ORF type:complete len:213 (-),score=27.11 TRINITY_DN2854_c0_g1_i2:80-718(-)